MTTVQRDDWASLAVEVDPAFCEGYGVCVGIDDSIFALDDEEDRVVILKQATSPEEFATIEAAAQRCPKRALRIVARPAVSDETTE